MGDVHGEEEEEGGGSPRVYIGLTGDEPLVSSPISRALDTRTGFRRGFVSTAEEEEEEEGREWKKARSKTYPNGSSRTRRKPDK